MSADVFGGQVLSEVKEETLNRLLQLLRNLGPRNRLGIPELDRLLTIFDRPHSTVVSEQHRALLSSPQPHVVERKKSQRAPAVEIAGDAPCSGKTQLLYLIAAVSLEPKSYNGSKIGGKEGAVVWLDTDGRLSIQRIYTILYGDISRRVQTSIPISSTDIEQICDTCLQNLHIFHPQSSLSLIATINSLPAYLLNPSRHYSSPRPLQLIIISSLNAFLAQDRLDADAETSNVTSLQHRPGINNIVSSRYAELVSSLREVQNFFDCVIIGGSWSFTPVQHTTNGPMLRSHLPSPWNSFCTIKFVIERATIPKFGQLIPLISAEESFREVGGKQEAIQKGKSFCLVNHIGSDVWDDAVHVGLGELAMNGGFSFRVTEDGAWIDEENLTDG